MIENLPPDHAAAAAAALDEVALTTALGGALGGGAAAPSLLAALRLSELLVRVGGPTAAALRGGLPALEPRSLAAAMTGGSAHATRADVQEAFAALLCALIRRGGSPQQLEDAVRAPRRRRRAPAVGGDRAAHARGDWRGGGGQRPRARTPPRRRLGPPAAAH